MLLKVDITEQDIKSGEQRSGFNCPTALGIKRAFSEKFGVSPAWIHVGYDILMFSLDKSQIHKAVSLAVPEHKSQIHKAVSLAVPEHIKKIISYYDLHNLMLPFSFELEVPCDGE